MSVELKSARELEVMRQSGRINAEIRALLCEAIRPGVTGLELDRLAKEAGTSRSVLTDRFSRFLGRGPIAYLADWRLELAAEALRGTSRSVMQVATEVGYDSEAAFNRAFKRRFGEPPARYRTVHRARRATA